MAFSYILCVWWQHYNEILGVNQSFWKIFEIGWKIVRGKSMLESILTNYFAVSFEPPITQQE